MNPIQLTPEHKTKLLEMCSKLFSEYKLRFDVSNTFLYDANKLMASPVITGIHWFEFCCTILVDQLCIYLEQLNEYKSTNDFRNLFYTYTLNKHDYTSHPIDYLYEEFKKLKL